jgi:putative phosphoesterase
MKLGIISDTHNRFHPQIPTVFAGVDHIVHAGDVCDPWIIAELHAIAPVTVVLGNNDFHPGWREAESVEFAGRRFLIQHIVTPSRPSPAFREMLGRARPDVVVFGHTHRVFNEVIDGVHFLNPGSAGAPRFGLPPSVCRLDLAAPRLQPEFIELGHRA